METQLHSLYKFFEVTEATDIFTLHKQSTHLLLKYSHFPNATLSSSTARCIYSEQLMKIILHLNEVKLQLCLKQPPNVVINSETVQYSVNCQMFNKSKTRRSLLTVYIVTYIHT